LEIFRRDAEPLARDLQDRPFLGGLGDLDVGLGGTVLRGAGLSFHCGSRRRSHVSLVPTASLVVVANSPAATFRPSRALTRRTFMRPSSQTTVNPSVPTSTISPILPPIPFGLTAGNGFASNTCSAWPSSEVQAPGAGLQPRMRL